MPGLEHSLEGHDFAYLRSVAVAWRLELDAADARAAAGQLAAQIPALAADPDELPAACRRALQEMSAAGGRLPWARFVRTYGELREMGAARLEKEHPERNPISLSEQLWYRALVGRAFFDSPDGPREFAFVPDELLELAPAGETTLFGRLARPEERAHPAPASECILDEAVSLLAALRIGMPPGEAAERESWQTPPRPLQAMLAAAGLLATDGKVNSEATRAWLGQPPNQALAYLAKAWQHSAEFNELRLLPDLVVEGSWRNDGLATRGAVLDLLRALPADQWWSLAAFVTDVKAQRPDFQRPAGDFESWYLRDAQGNYLRGFEHWDQVDGVLLAFMLRGPLHWLGYLDLAAPQAGAPAAAFRWSAWSAALLTGAAPALPEAKAEKVKVDSHGLVSVPRGAGRAVRYQLARFCDWLPTRREGYQYQITERSLAGARRQGLKAGQLVTLLRSNLAGSLPPNLLQALKRWELQGSQASLRTLLVLRLPSQAAYKALRASRAARWLGKPLGPLAVEVKPGAGPQVLQALLELGYLGEIEGDE